MTKARNLQRTDKLAVEINAEVLSIEPLPNGLVKVRIAAINTPSLDFAYGSGVIEIVCKSGRIFSSRPWRPDDGLWPPRPDDDDDDGGPDQPVPSNLTGRV